MPNWCNNTLTLNGGSDDSILDVLKDYLNGAGHLSFEKIRPIPSELKSMRAPAPESMDEATRKELIRNYGADNWWDWCVMNWGTKWDCDVPRKPEGRTLRGDMGGPVKLEFTKTSTIKKLEAAVGSLLADENQDEKRVVFSVYRQAPGGSEVEHPDIESPEPILKGKYRFMIDYWRVANKPVYSQEFTDPTWKDAINACNRLLETGDGCGVFLEDIRDLGNGTAELTIGS